MEAATVPGLFWRTTAQGLFERVWTSYKKEYCNPEQLEVRAHRMRERIQQQSATTAITTEQIKSQLVKHEPKAFDRYRSTFFMCDIMPEHSTRFSVKYVA